ncbi:MarR family transcriptional regulator [Micromonospora parva]|uniref:MarR family winged helix-turn-helix transcriptional regulator n=1 Tax=Micromonospora parva TaxID=1464048 RepID=UPI0033E63572
MTRGAGVTTSGATVAAFAYAVDASLDGWLGDNYRVGLTEFRALVVLHQEPHKELRVNDLAQRVSLNQSSTTRLVSRLEAKGLARRDLCQGDRRGVYAFITEQGQALAREVREPYEGRIRELLREAPTHFRHLDVRQLGDALSEIQTLIRS